MSTAQRRVVRAQTGPLFELTEGSDVCDGGVAHDDALDIGVRCIDGVYFAGQRAKRIVVL